MKNIDKYAEGYQAADKTIKAIQNISKASIAIFISRMEKEIEQMSPDDFETQSEYDDKFDWSDGYLARLEEEYF